MIGHPLGAIGSPGTHHSQVTVADEFTRQIVFEPGWATGEKDHDGQHYGRRAMYLRFVLHGPHGTIVWVLSTGWYPVQGPTGKPATLVDSQPPSAALIGIHWDDAGVNPGWLVTDDPCNLRPSGVCQYDCTYVQAEHVLPRLMRE